MRFWLGLAACGLVRRADDPPRAQAAVAANGTSAVEVASVPGLTAGVLVYKTLLVAGTVRDLAQAARAWARADAVAWSGPVQALRVLDSLVLINEAALVHATVQEDPRIQRLRAHDTRVAALVQQVAELNSAEPKAVASTARWLVAGAGGLTHLPLGARAETRGRTLVSDVGFAKMRLAEAEADCPGCDAGAAGVVVGAVLVNRHDERLVPRLRRKALALEQRLRALDALNLQPELLQELGAELGQELDVRAGALESVFRALGDAERIQEVAREFVRQHDLRREVKAHVAQLGRSQKSEKNKHDVPDSIEQVTAMTALGDSLAECHGGGAAQAAVGQFGQLLRALERSLYEQTGLCAELEAALEALRLQLARFSRGSAADQRRAKALLGSAAKCADRRPAFVALRQALGKKLYLAPKLPWATKAAHALDDLGVPLDWTLDVIGKLRSLGVAQALRTYYDLTSAAALVASAPASAAFASSFAWLARRVLEGQGVGCADVLRDLWNEYSVEVAPDGLQADMHAGLAHLGGGAGLSSVA